MRLFISVIAVIFLLASCEKFTELSQSRVVATGKTKNNADTILFDEAARVFFSRLTHSNSIGMRVTCSIPQTKNDQELYVVLEGRARTNYANSNSGIALSGNNHKGEQLCWRFLPLRYFYTDLNTWCHFKDSIYIKTNYQWKNYIRFTAHANLTSSANEIFDLDSLTLTVKRLDN